MPVPLVTTTANSAGITNETIPTVASSRRGIKILEGSVTKSALTHVPAMARPTVEPDHQSVAAKSAPTIFKSAKGLSIADRSWENFRGLRKFLLSCERKVFFYLAWWRAGREGAWKEGAGREGAGREACSVPQEFTMGQDLFTPNPPVIHNPTPSGISSSEPSIFRLVEPLNTMRVDCSSDSGVITELLVVLRQAVTAGYTERVTESADIARRSAELREEWRGNVPLKLIEEL